MAPYIRDKVKLHFLKCFTQEMLAPQGYDLKALERIGDLGAVFLKKLQNDKQIFQMIRKT